jgi:hypothetical protein
LQGGSPRAVFFFTCLCNFGATRNTQGVMRNHPQDFRSWLPGKLWGHCQNREGIDLATPRGRKIALETTIGEMFPDQAAVLSSCPICVLRARFCAGADGVLCAADRAAFGSPICGGMSRAWACPFWSSFECEPHGPAIRSQFATRTAVSSESAKALDRRGEAYARRGFYCCDGAVCGRRRLVRTWLRKVKVGVPL